MQWCSIHPNRQEQIIGTNKVLKQSLTTLPRVSLQMSESLCMLQGTAVAWDTSFCVSVKEYAPLANGKQQKLKKIAGIVRSLFLFFFFLGGNK